MPNRPALPRILSLALAALLAAGAGAETSVPPASAMPAVADDSTLRQAQARLQADQELCIKEATPRARLQCRREAMADYEKAVAAAKPREGAMPATAAAPAASAPSRAASGAATTCSDCGRVLAVREVSPPNGSFAGRVLERRMEARKGWVVDVQYDRQDQVMHYVFPQEPGFKVGDKVRPEGSGIARP